MNFTNYILIIQMYKIIQFALQEMTDTGQTH